MANGCSFALTSEATVASMLAASSRKHAVIPVRCGHMICAVRSHLGKLVAWRHLKAGQQTLLTVSTCRLASVPILQLPAPCSLLNISQGLNGFSGPCMNYPRSVPAKCWSQCPGYVFPSDLQAASQTADSWEEAGSSPKIQVSISNPILVL